MGGMPLSSPSGARRYSWDMRLSQDNDSQKMDAAARAAWLYFIAGNTQDEIAKKLRISRPTAQRLVTAALSNHLVTFRFEHSIAQCMELSEKLRDRYNLKYCEVVPTDADAPDATSGISSATASLIERTLGSPTPVVMAVGTGRTLRAAIENLHPMDAAQHELVGLVGNIGMDGSSTLFDVIGRLALLSGARHFPVALPVLLESEEQRNLLTAMRFVQGTHAMAARADVTIVGVGQMDAQAPQHIDGFISEAELAEQISLGAVGEIVGWSFDRNGQVLAGGINKRITAAPLRPCDERLVVGVAGGKRKVQALHAAIIGGLLSGLITDENTAELLLAL